MSLRFQVPSTPSPLQAATKYVLSLLGAVADEGSRFAVVSNGSTFFGIKPMLSALSATHNDAILGRTPSEKVSVAQWVTTALQASIQVVGAADIEPLLPGAGKFLANSDSPTVADLMLYSVVASAIKSTPKQYPNLSNWVAALEKTPTLQPIRVAGGDAAPKEAGSEVAKARTSARPSEDEIAARKAEKEAARLAKEAQKATEPPKAATADAADGEEGKDVKKTAKKALNPADLDLRIGKIVSAERHPDSDKLLVERIDVGDKEGPRTIVSGLAADYTPEQILGAHCLVLCNLKPRALAGVTSAGMVLCASNDTQGLSLITAPTAPPGAPVFVGSPGPARPNSPSSKQMEELLKHFHTDGTGTVCWQEQPLRVNGHDAVVSSQLNAVVK